MACGYGRGGCTRPSAWGGGRQPGRVGDDACGHGHHGEILHKQPHGCFLERTFRDAACWRFRAPCNHTIMVDRGPEADGPRPVRFRCRGRRDVSPRRASAASIWRSKISGAGDPVPRTSS
jgi:hypothetical protein